MSINERRERYERARNRNRTSAFIERLEADDEKPHGIVVETVALSDEGWLERASIGPAWTLVSEAVLDAGAADLTTAEQPLAFLAAYENRYDAIEMLESLTASTLMKWVAETQGADRLPVGVLMAPLNGEVGILPVRHRQMLVHMDVHGSIGYRLGSDESETDSVYVRWADVPYADALELVRSMGPYTAITLSGLLERLGLEPDRYPSVMVELPSGEEARRWVIEVSISDCVSFRDGAFRLGEPFSGNSRYPDIHKTMLIRWDEHADELRFLWLLSGDGR
ncbi:hypothetical protein [Caniella muris]|uniref:hypothetical protein n=1 Tax=Caniella muris TaxID=2941502 RepID=UPI00203EB930|nr:hypothetical protein [Caniella muris]